jgi:hypothetical protein
MTASLLRKRSRSRPFLIDSPALSVEELSASTFCTSTMTGPGVEMLCRIAHNPPKTSSGLVTDGERHFRPLDRSEQLRPAIILTLSDDDGGDELFFSLYSGL